MQKTLKGTLGATFRGIGEDFGSLLVVSLVPAMLFTAVNLSGKLVTIRQYIDYLSGNQAAFSTGALAWLGAMVLPLAGVYVTALWFTVIAVYLSPEGRAKWLPSGIDLKNAVFVVIYAIIFLVLPFLLIFGLAQFGFYLADKPLLSGGTVTIPWQESAPLLAAMVVVLPLFFLLLSVCDANLPRIARGYRPNLFREVFSFSKGVRTALTVRTLVLYLSIFLLFFLFATFLILPIMSYVTSGYGPVAQNDAKALATLQIKVQWVNIYLEPIFTILITPLLWFFSLFWHEVDARLSSV